MKAKALLICSMGLPAALSAALGASSRGCVGSDDVTTLDADICQSAPRGLQSRQQQEVEEKQDAMPVKDAIKGLKADLEGFLGRRNAQTDGVAPQSAIETHWRPEFASDTAVSAEWEHKIGNGQDGWGNQESQYYTAESKNSYHKEGHLILRAVANNNSNPPELSSARLVSRRTLGRDQGVLTANIKLPCAKGLWPAFWLLPKEPFSWPTDGEVDIAESWDGDLINHSCFHWGTWANEELWKHSLMETRIDDMCERFVRFDFAWRQLPENPGQSKMVWYIDGKRVMKAVPRGNRPLRDMTVVLNIAMGGIVVQHKIPDNGEYEMVVASMSMTSEPLGGWRRFEDDWDALKEAYSGSNPQPGPVNLRSMTN